MTNKEDNSLNFSYQELAQLHTELIKAVLWYQETKSTKGHHALFTDKQGTPHVDVLATLTSDTVKVPDLVIRSRIGLFVTGHVALKNIIKVHAHPDVKELEGARILFPTLSDSVKDVDASAEQLKQAPAEALRDSNNNQWYLDGSGVIIGVIDNFIDFTSKNFRKHDHSGTRILNLWNQNGFSLNPHFAAPMPFGYGNEYNKDQINHAISQSVETGLVVLDYSNSSPPVHGSFVTDIITGGGYLTNEAGIAPNADIIFVDFANEDIDEEALSNSSRLLDAANYIFTKANGYQRPVVINISQNSNGGPHDGTDIIDQAFDALLTHNRAIAIGAGNSGGNKTHAMKGLAPGDSTTLHWNTTNTSIHTEMELWYPNTTHLTCTIKHPGDDFTQTIVHDTSDNITLILDRDNVVIGKVIAKTVRGVSKTFDIILPFTGVPHGKWTITLHNTGTVKVDVHGWIERGSAFDLQGSFDEADNHYTLGSISCGHNTIVVAAYDHTKSGKPISDFSSQGPTRDGRRKPDLCAPGENIFALNWQINAIDGPKGGTSFATPHVTGILAVLIQAAHYNISSRDIKKFLLAGAQRYPDGLRDFLAQGQGRANALFAVETIYL